MAAVLLGHAEVEADRLGVTDVQITIGLRREAGDDTAIVLARTQVVLDDLADEIRVACSGPYITCHYQPLYRRPSGPLGVIDAMYAGLKGCTRWTGRRSGPAAPASSRS